MKNVKCKFAVGQLIHHALFDYRGVIIDIDPEFYGTEEWYEQVALSKPPKNKPWYHVLVHGAEHATYVAERNLEREISMEPINHPLVDEYFLKFQNGKYLKEMN